MMSLNPQYDIVQDRVLLLCEEYAEWQGETADLAALCHTSVPTLLVALELLANDGAVAYCTAHKHYLHVDVLEGN